MNRCCERPTSPRGLLSTRAAAMAFASPTSTSTKSRTSTPVPGSSTTAAGPRSVARFGTFERLDPSRIEHYRSGHVFIPTLAEALLLTKEQDWLVNVEIKSFPERPPALVGRVLDLITETGTADRVLISSYDHEDIAEANPRNAGIPWESSRRLRSIASTTTRQAWSGPIRSTSPPRSSGPTRSPIVARAWRQTLRHDMVTALKRRGLPTLVYTVNHQADGNLARHLAEIGVDGLFTDDPQGLKQKLDSHPAGTRVNPESPS